ncbi:MAG: hypothetical protein AAF533_26200 [Acidobacteriota bacterium]
MRIPVVCAVLLLFSCPSRAEVRLQPFEESRVVVSMGNGAAWTPVAGATTLHLNPGGDHYGDGLPVHLAHDGSDLVAWYRHLTGSIHLAVAGPGATSWTKGDEVILPDAFGTVRLVGRPDGWLLATNEVASDPAINLVGVRSDGKTTESLDFTEGLLAEMMNVRETIHVVAMVPEGNATGTFELRTTSFTCGMTIPVAPITIGLIGQVTLDELGSELPVIETAEIGHVGQMGTTTIELPPASEPAALAPDIRSHRFTDDSGEVRHVLTWWRSQNTLRAVELGEDGPILPFTQRSSGVPHDPDLTDGILQDVVGN